MKVINNEIEFEYNQPPRGKQRPRFCVDKKGKKRAFTPKETYQYEKELGNFVKKIMFRLKLKRFEEKIPLVYIVHAFYPIPKSTNKTMREQMLSGKVLPTKKPDADNVLKIILDALNKISYHDDAQICGIVFSKRYGSVPRISVKIKEIKT